MTTATVDDRKRVRLPDAKPGQVLTIEPGPNGGWFLAPVVKAETADPFPRGSLLKYVTSEYNREQLEVLKGCVLGPGPDEPNE